MALERLLAETGPGVPDAGAVALRPWPVLSAGDCFVLWAVRQWTRCMTGRDTGTGEIYDAFEFHGALDALRPMNRFMTAILVGRHRDLSIADPHAVEVSPDEAAILRALALAQAGHADLCETRLMTWLPRAAARVAMPHARRLGRTLAARGLVLTLEAARRV